MITPFFEWSPDSTFIFFQSRNTVRNCQRISIFRFNTEHYLKGIVLLFFYVNL
jgi:hypothetical protein